MKTTPYYWDCECPTHYIHSKRRKMCKKCGAYRDEQPDSVLSEVEKYKGTEYINY
jgi:hypothetical protein